jgi:leader peptidase (prepilin peptidase) / N-methyltransferase
VTALQLDESAVPDAHTARGEVRLAASLAAAIASAAAVAQFGLSSRTAIAWGFFAVLAVLSVIDIEQRRLPNAIVVPAAVAMLAAQITVAPERTLEWVLAAIGAFLGMLVFAVVRPGGLGMGDVKLALLLGAALGQDVLLALVIGSAAGAVYGLALIARHGAAGRRMHIAYGPFLAAGAAIVFLLG